MAAAAYLPRRHYGHDVGQRVDEDDQHIPLHLTTDNQAFSDEAFVGTADQRRPDRVVGRKRYFYQSIEDKHTYELMHLPEEHRKNVAPPNGQCLRGPR